MKGSAFPLPETGAAPMLALGLGLGRAAIWNGFGPADGDNAGAGMGEAVLPRAGACAGVAGGTGGSVRGFVIGLKGSEASSASSADLFEVVSPDTGLRLAATAGCDAVTGGAAQRAPSKLTATASLLSSSSILPISARMLPSCPRRNTRSLPVRTYSETFSFSAAASTRSCKCCPSAILTILGTSCTAAAALETSSLMPAMSVRSVERWTNRILARP